MRQAAAAAASLRKFAPFKPFSTRDSIERLLWGASHIIMSHPDPECSVSARFGLLVDIPRIRSSHSGRSRSRSLGQAPDTSTVTCRQACRVDPTDGAE